MIRALKALWLSISYRIATSELDFMMSAAAATEQRVIELTRRAADLQRARMLHADPMLARKAAGQVIHHNFRRAPQLRVVAGGKDAA